jgi:hypothetical protein
MAEIMQKSKLEATKIIAHFFYKQFKIPKQSMEPKHYRAVGYQRTEVFPQNVQIAPTKCHTVVTVPIRAICLADK